MIFAIDIDGILCSHSVKHYDNCIPDRLNISFINELYDRGHTIHIYTARGTASGKDWVNYTKQQLAKWGVQYHNISFNKPHADVFIDDKSYHSIHDYLKYNYRDNLTVATAGYFDPVHSGHIELFKKSRELGNRLVVILGNDECLIRKKGYVFMPLQDRFLTLGIVLNRFFGNRRESCLAMAL